MTDDAALLRRYAETHAEDAFAEIVRRHLAFVYGSAFRRLSGDGRRAEEIAQRVFTDLARKAEAVARHPSLAGWLHTSTRFATAALMRSEARRKIYEQAAVNHQESEMPALAWDRLRPVIDEALDQLDNRDRSAVLLRFFEKQSFAGIGEALGLSDEAARKRVDRALERLRVVLVRKGILSTAALVGVALANQVVVAVPAGFAGTVITSAIASAGAPVVGGVIPSLAMAKLSTGFTAALLVAIVATVGTAAFTVAFSHQRTERDGLARLSVQESGRAVEGLNALRTQLADVERKRDAALVELKKRADAREKRRREEEVALYGPDRMLQRRLLFRRNNERLFNRLALDEARRKKLIAIEIEADVAGLAATLLARKTMGDDDAPGEVHEKIWATEFQQLKELLGPNGYDAYFEALDLKAGVVHDLSVDLADAGAPLSEEFQWRIAHLYRELVSKPEEAAPTSVRRSTGELSATQQVFLNTVSAELNPEQLRVLRNRLLE